VRQFIFIIIILAVVFFIFSAIVGSSPEEKEKSQARDAISLCWSDQEKKSNTPGEARFIAGACEKMESDYKTKYGVSP